MIKVCSSIKTTMLKNKQIIQQGERGKYFIRSDKRDFNLETDNYWLEIIHGMPAEKIVIHKSEFLNLLGRWVFSFPTDNIVGPVLARLVMEIFDPDCPDGLRTEIDEQYIAFVVTNPCPQFFKCPCCFGTGEHEIVYDRTEESDIGSRYARLCDVDGHPFRTSDDGYLYVLRELTNI